MLKSKLRRWWIISGFIFILLLLWPVEYRLTRVGLIFFLLLTWFGAVLTWWEKKAACGLLVFAAGVPLIGFCLPGREVNPDELSAGYARALRSYDGVRYVWGGENRLGIDCSGLARKGLVRALLTDGARTLNGRAMRDAACLWWRDASARALKEGYRDWTSELFRAESINRADFSKLRRGDMAVTEDGIHVLVFLGEGKWIEADPEVKRVIEVAVPTENPWFEVPVVFVRWKWMKPASAH